MEIPESYTWILPKALEVLVEHRQGPDRVGQDLTVVSRADDILLCLEQRFPGLSQTTLDVSKIQYNKFLVFPGFVQDMHNLIAALCCGAGRLCLLVADWSEWHYGRGMKAPLTNGNGEVVRTNLLADQQKLFHLYWDIPTT
ncbi:hypothetical protein QYE76_062740 [Lolium multiflorum]|uniref:PRONE domain-containing protein n=1 Tax=Lolium multiflorum TaxID=4521 RepID=A0AAD8S4B1_LOLMU|nr:hypothetical protein QYE76_062740 [Lolium multiflorum]